MKNETKPSVSPRTLTLTVGATLMVAGSMIPSPGGRLMCAAIAGFIACVALFFRRSRIRRAIAWLILAVAVLQILSSWRPYLDSLDQYRAGAPFSHTDEGLE